jgi:hypothetical protein
MCLQFAVAFTRDSTGKRHHIAMDAQVRVSLFSSGRVSYTYTETSGHEDFFEGGWGCVENGALREALISDLCNSFFGVDMKVARFIAREYVGKRMLERAVAVKGKGAEASAQ